MKLLFSKKENEGIPVSDSMGLQEVVAAIADEGDIIVMILDHYTHNVYIEKIIDKLSPDMYRSSNFMRIEDDEEWNTYKRFLVLCGVMPDV